jgi:hypothetical protein
VEVAAVESVKASAAVKAAEISAVEVVKAATATETTGAAMETAATVKA